MQSLQRQNNYADANTLARIESAKLEQLESSRRQKMESFLNTTKLNASKIQKQAKMKQSQLSDSKQALIKKQKAIMENYTYKKEPRPSQPARVEWKEAKNPTTITIPQEKLQPAYDSQSDDGCESEVDSDAENGTVLFTDILKKREALRMALLNKCKQTN